MQKSGPKRTATTTTANDNNDKRRREEQQEKQFLGTASSKRRLALALNSSLLAHGMSLAVAAFLNCGQFYNSINMNFYTVPESSEEYGDKLVLCTQL